MQNQESLLSFDRKISKVETLLESATDPAIIDKLKYTRDTLGEEKVEFCKMQIEKAGAFLEDGTISETYFKEVKDAMEAAMDETYKTIHPYYAEAATVLGFAKSVGEGMAMLDATFRMIPPLGALVTSPVKAYITKRLGNYNILFPDAVPIKELKGKKYTYDEWLRKSDKKFKYADKWFESGNLVDIHAWEYHKKIVCGVAYTKHSSSIGARALVEPIIFDSSFKQHEDYYIAFMCTSVRISHPAIKRTLTRLKNGWTKELKLRKQVIKESAEELLASGLLGEKIQLIEEAATYGFIDKESMNLYLEELTKERILF